MSNQIVPNTESTGVADSAIAWEIIKSSGIIQYLTDNAELSALEVIQKVTNLQIKITRAIHKETLLTLDDVKIEAGK